MEESQQNTPRFTLQEQRAIIKYLYYAGKNPIDIHREMAQVCRRELMNVKNIRSWVRKFRGGRESTVSEKPGRKMSLEKRKILERSKRYKRKGFMYESYSDRDTELENYLKLFLPGACEDMGLRNKRPKIRKSKKEIKTELGIENFEPIEPEERNENMEPDSNVQFIKNTEQAAEFFMNALNESHIEFVTDGNVNGVVDGVPPNGASVIVENVPTVNIQLIEIPGSNGLGWQLV